LGSFRYGTANALDYSTLTAGANYDNTTAQGTANLEFSINGAATTGHVVSVNLAAGDATSGSVTGTTDLTTVSTTAGHILNVAVDGGGVQAISLATDATGTALITDINSKLVGATASLVVAGGQTHLKITSNTFGAGSSVATSAGTGLAEAFGGVATGTGLSRTLSSVEQAINQTIAGDTTLQAAGLQATDNGAGALKIVSNNGTYFQLNAYGANADLGFGTTGAAFGGGNVQSATGVSDYQSGGAYQTPAFSFSGISHGNDAQTITVTTNNSAGQQQAQSIVLQNVGATRNAQNIDDAVAAINSALQKSNIAALQGIVAVKDDSSGEKIRFLSTNAFSVSIGTDANGTGVQSQGTNNAAAVIGTGSTADISNASTASAAVSALANSVTKLGQAQAVVGRGENQFNYAINLASSQLTNFAAAESQIRDADLAAESANLTKSQILLQAGIAALAQANSAPQQVLTLLHG